jgi:HPr kinase/phosphorylase
MADAATVHASAVLVGAQAVLIRGQAGVGKSRLALALIRSATSGQVGFARLVGDDRVHLEPHHGRMLVRPAAALAGLVEVRGLGIRRLPYEPIAVVGWVVDLATFDVQRMPVQSDLSVVIAGIRLPRLAVASGEDPLPFVLAMLATPDAGRPSGGPAEEK